ncbi:OmpA family protein [Candidatus Campbellbacteria bacterium]|nr:MAG: OmpA family protein [Candidatus Campbellbacteria bacterium]
MNGNDQRSFWARLGPLPKLGIIIAAFFVGYLGLDYFGLIPGSNIMKSILPKQVDLPTLSTASSSATQGFVPSSAPSNTPARMSGPQMRIAGWAWSSQMGLWYAMGGNVPMDGSLMAKYGSNVYWYRQDDVSQMQADLVTCATEMSSSGGSECSGGATHVSIMWDGAPAFVTTVNNTLGRLGSEYTVEYVGSLGYSRGEDKCMGLPEWKHNPQAMRGALFAGVITDGDWNVCLKFQGDNGVINNRDETTYDPDAVNWVRAASYMDAAEKYITGYCEDRPVVKNGRRTGDAKHVCVNGVATWTPGDVMVAQKKGGLVSLASTKEYSSQMPNAIIGIKKFDTAHPELVVNFLRAALEGGDNIKFSPAALDFAAKVSADVYREETAAYWKKYYTVVRERDKKGIEVELGGSYANNLADNLRLFGLTPGSAKTAKLVYENFGSLLSQQYPKDFPMYTPVDQVINTRFIEELRDRVGVTTTADAPTFTSSTRIRDEVSRKAWQINFVSGSAQFTPDALAKLQQLLKDLVIAEALAVEVHGHTDSDGDDESNMLLSEQRAFAVKEWLEHEAPANFPNGRIRIRAFGETEPKASNTTSEGKAQNRRVEIVLGSTN